MSRHSRDDNPASSPDAESWRNAPPKPRRKKVVLADVGKPVVTLRTLSELEAQTSVGEALVRNLVRAQLKLAGLIAAVVVVLFGSLPVAFYFSPTFASLSVAGVRLPWLLLGVLPFPVLFGAGYWYNRRTERHEKDFVNMVES